MSTDGYVKMFKGREAAALFLVGKGSAIDKHLLRSGKRCWRYKVPEAIHTIAFGDDSIFAITSPGGDIFGRWQEDAKPGSKLRAIRRRTFINRLRKF